jgi:hypothetical protein
METILSRRWQQIWSAAGLIVPLLILMAALAQAQFKIETAPAESERRPRVLAPPLGADTTRIPDLDSYPNAPNVPYDPAFIEPFTTTIETPTSTGRAGLSGWTSPSTPVGAAATGHREHNGWLGFGFSATWGAPVPPRNQAPPAASVSNSESPRPMRVGDLVRRKTERSPAAGRVLTFFDREGVTVAVVQWLDRASSEPTNERLDQLTLVH